MNDKKAQTRQRILDAACRALIQRGPTEPSVSDIMSAAGLTVGGFYAHFESKDALMLEAFKHLLAVRRGRVDEVDPGFDGAQRRNAVAAFYLSRRHRDEQGDQACALPTSVGHMSNLPETFREALAEHICLMAEQLTVNPEEAEKAFADIALMLGGLALARALGPSELSDRVLRASKAAIL